VCVFVLERVSIGNEMMVRQKHVRCTRNSRVPPTHCKLLHHTRPHTLDMTRALE